MVATAPAAVLVAACGAIGVVTPTPASPSLAQPKPTPVGIASAAPAATAPAAAPAAAPTATPAAVAPAASKPAAGPTAAPAAVGTGVAGAATKPAAGGGGATAEPAAAGSGGCELTPEQTEGPYYIDAKLVRSDITEGKPGVALTLELVVQDPACQPIPGATVEIWQCDALGEYSGFSAAAMQAKPQSGYTTPLASAATQAAKPGPPPAKPPPDGAGGPGARQTPTNQLVFLRGGQVAGADGKVTFQTIYPGWYQGRTPHIHVKVHAGGLEVHTGQLYFDELITKQVYAEAPYASKGAPDTTNETDSIYRDGGDRSQLALTKVGEAYAGAMTLVVRR
jgi:protocatechuate 3,4-dioxygenase beta subunit